MKNLRIRLGALALGFAALAGVALAQEVPNNFGGSGFWANWPVLGGASYCSSYVNHICRLTIPAGPLATGSETSPADTHQTQGSPPQQVLVPLISAGIGGMDQVTPVTAFTIAVPNGTTHLILTPAGTLATGTIDLPLGVVNGQTFSAVTTQTQTAVTFAVATGSGQTIVGGPTAMTANTPVRFIYDASNTTWYIN